MFLLVNAIIRAIKQQKHISPPSSHITILRCVRQYTAYQSDHLFRNKNETVEDQEIKRKRGAEPQVKLTVAKMEVENFIF